jgi:Zn-dependent M16 (insulinase) family peptidase
MLFTRNNLIVSVTDRAAHYDEFAAEFDKFQQKLGTESYPVQEYHWDLQAKNEGLTSSSRVQYVGKGANFLKLGHAFTGTMHVLETILRYDYFWTKIRVQGGAYGAFTSFNRNGMMYFGSYRDPNLTETLAVFDGTADYLRNFAASEREMDKYIIGTMSNIDTPLTPKMKGSAAATCWLRGITEADRQKSRDEILDTRQKDVQKLADMVKDCMEQNVICVFGGQEKINEHKEVFGEVRPAL